MDNKAIEFAQYRLERAKETLKTAKVIFDIKDYKSANNRAYYAIFYAIRAVLAVERKDFKRHKDVIAYFNQNYINTEIFPKKLGHKISLAQSIREDSDYDDEYIASKEKTQTQLETAEELIKQVEQYIENLKNNISN
ncbi:MAG: HEPN domain-containing protein [Clostridia bacterium]|nr:HEPN domain-containing protein [Clostridia bacterium]